MSEQLYISILKQHGSVEMLKLYTGHEVIRQTAQYCLVVVNNSSVSTSSYNCLQ